MADPEQVPSRQRTRRPLARATALVLLLIGNVVLAVAMAAPGKAAITTPFIRVFNTSVAGDIQIRGNTLLTCQDTASLCAGARANSLLNNNSFFMTYVDVDGDASTFNSSSSTVDVPAGGSVLFAALTWGGDTNAGGLPPAGTPAEYGAGTPTGAPAPAAAGSVKLKVPNSGTYSAVASTRTTFLSGSAGAFQGYADVTTQVQAAGNGSYTVANVQTATGNNKPGGWALTVAYAHPSDPPRNLSVFTGFGTVGQSDVVDFTISGFETPPSGPVRTSLGAISYEGDAGSVGDQMQLGNTTSTLKNVADDLHPVGNSFFSVISDDGVDSSIRNPRYLNQLGYDASTISVDGFLANGSTSAVIRLTSATTTGETYYPGVVTFASELYTPKLTATKTMSIAAKGNGNIQSGIIEPGDVLQYTVGATNDGGDASADTVLNDVVPTWTSYKPGTITSGGTAVTDAVGDDVGRYDLATNTIKVNVGSGATQAAGGQLAIGAAIAPVTFQVVVDGDTPGGTLIANTATFAFTGNGSGVAVAGSSNAVATPVVAHHSDLGVTKTADVGVAQKGQSTPVTYTLTVTNSGPYDDPGVTVTDTLAVGAVVTAAVPSTGTCTTPTGLVACDIGALANGLTATVAVTVNLDAAADPAVDQATVTGTNEDANPANDTDSLSTAVNAPPTAGPDSATTSGGTSTITVLDNDADADHDPLSVTPGATTPTKGSILVNVDQTITYTATAGAAGGDSFSYIVADDRGGSVAAMVTITIPNAPPVANDDSTTSTPGGAVVVPVLTNDTDPNIPTSGQSLSVLSVTQPTGGEGTVTVALDGSTVTFTPSPTFRVGTATFSYVVSDGATGTDTASVTVTVPNVGPAAAADVVSTPYLGAATFDVLANDSDDNGDPLTVTLVTGASHGTAIITGTGSNTKVLYTPAAGWSGTDTMTYTISDGTTTTTGSLSVTTGNGTPAAGSFSTTVDGGVATTITVLTSTSDPNGDTLTVTGAGPAAHGTVTSDGSGGVTYTPNPTYAGADAFDYTVNDGNHGTATGTVTITVRNQAPVADDDVAPVPGGSSVDIVVLTNDSDPNLDTLTILSVTLPAHGTATIEAGGVIRYTPAPTFLGDDTFSYTVDDGHGGTDPADITVTVANQPPLAGDDAAVAAGAAGSPITIDVLDNDTDPNDDPLTIVSAGVPAHGTAVVLDGKIVYTPDASYVGADSFGYTIDDGRGALSGATVTVDVQNRAPVATADTLAASTGVAATVDVISNDTDPDAETVSLVSVDPTSTAGGSVMIVSGVVHYVSAVGFSGTDTFTYVATDPRGATATGMVTVTVSNADPVALDRAATTTTDTSTSVDLLQGVTDADGQPLTVVSAGPAAHGTVTVNGSGVATYTPSPGYAGTDTFVYTVSDGQGGTVTRTVTITVSNAAPQTVGDSASTAYDSPVTVDVLANDGDPNIPGSTQALAIESATVLSGGADVTMTATGRVTVDPHPGFAGEVVVRYTVSDGAGGSVSGQLTVLVLIPLPHGVADSATTTFERGVAIDVLANDDSGQAGAAPTIVAGSVTTPRDSTGTARGSVTLLDGRLHFLPPSGYAGTVTFEYTVTNPLGGTDRVTVTVTTQAQVIETLAVEESLTASRDSLTIDPASRITGHGALTIVSLTQPTEGATVAIVDGRMVVTRLDGFVGAISFSYVVVGEDGAQVTVAVVVQALGASASRGAGAGDGDASSDPGSPLARTGASIAFVTLGGLLLIGLGAASLRLGRAGRPRARPARR